MDLFLIFVLYLLFSNSGMVSPILGQPHPFPARRDQLRLLKALDPEKFSDGLRHSIAQGVHAGVKECSQESKNA